MYQLEIDSTTYFNLDNYYVTFESGLPKGNYKLNEIIGDGGLVDGVGSIGGRIVSISRAFTKAKESDRQDFLNWFTMPNWKTIYLRRNSTYFNGLSQVYPMLSGGESYQIRNFNIAKDIRFEMAMADPYFTSTSLTTSTAISVTSTSELSTSVTISGAKVYAYYQYTFSTNATDFDLQVSNGYGFHIDYNFQTGDILKVHTSDSALLAYVNGVRIDGYFSSGSTPFELNSSVNNLYIKTGSTGTLTVNYYERQL